MTQKIKIIEPFRTQWIDLLSGEVYEQTIGRLVREDNTFDRNKGYCCLGVACDILHHTTKKFQWKLDIIGWVMDGDDVDFTPKVTKYLFPDYVQVPTWTLDIYNKNRILDFINELIMMNDAGASHKEIAEYIVEHTVGA